MIDPLIDTETPDERSDESSTRTGQAPIDAGSARLQRVAVTGARGQLGHRLCQLLGAHALPLDSDTCDLADAAQMRRHLQRLEPRLIINAAAYTAVDRAETDAERCRAVNCDAVETLVQVSNQLGCSLVQLSTDYVFCDAHPLGRPWREDDPIAPRGVYARSKADAEQIALAYPRSLVVRTCGLYGPTPPAGSSNFVSTMLRLGRERQSVRVVDDQICCPTYVAELADALLHLAASQQYGIYHVVNREGLSWYEFAREIFRLASVDCVVTPISSEAYGAAAPRPAYSELDTSKYQQTGGPTLSTCRAALAGYLAERTAPS
jgi:dTDP-4-dehydrorhamnose reductase